MLQGEYKKLKSLEAVSHLEGVVLLKNYAKANATNAIDTLLSVFMERSESEIKALCSTIKANLDLYRVIAGNPKQVKAIEEAIAPEE